MNAIDDAIDPTTILNKRFNTEVNIELMANPGFTDIRIYFINTEKEQYHIICKYQNFNLKLIIPNKYPFMQPKIYINDFNIDINWSPVNRINTFISDIIKNKNDKYSNQNIIIPRLGGFLNDGTDLSFNSMDLHDNGHLYDCRNFENNKYQFGSGFIYSILNQYFTDYFFPISKDMLNMFVSRLIDYPLIKEIGCVYLVLKIYEEQILLPIQNYFDTINKYLRSNDIKKQFNDFIIMFKKNNRIIMYDLVERLDFLNHILTIYINIWLYTNFRFDIGDIQFDDISYDLNGLIDSFLQIESNSDLYQWSMQFIGKDKKISEFNEHLFLDNYNYVENNLRTSEPNLNNFFRDFLTHINQFGNFGNDMLDQTNKINNSIGERHRISKYIEINPNATTFPESLIFIESSEIYLCNKISNILKQHPSSIVPNSFCENIKN